MLRVKKALESGVSLLFRRPASYSSNQQKQADILRQASNQSASTSASTSAHCTHTALPPHSKFQGSPFSQTYLLYGTGVMVAGSVGAWILWTRGDDIGPKFVHDLRHSAAEHVADGLGSAMGRAQAFWRRSAATDTLKSSPAVPLGPYFISDAASKAAPAVVNVAVQPSSGGPFANGNGSGLAHGSGGGNGGGCSGSGFIFDPNGTIITNAHVIADAFERPIGAPARQPPSLIVTLQDGRTFEGRVLSFDRVSDLAVVKIDSKRALPAVRLGKSSTLRVGEWVVALGSPMHLQNSITAGIVSCVDRKAVDLGLSTTSTDYIQTDAAVNCGSSGGPLVNLQGEVIGVQQMKAVAADGVSFAIPVDTAWEVVQQLLARGRVIRPFIGIKMLQLNTENASQLRARNPAFPAVSQGILVPSVMPGSPAAAAGFRPGDIITGFTGSPHQATTAGLIRALGEHVGRSLEVRVRRMGGEVELRVTAEEAVSQ